MPLVTMGAEAAGRLAAAGLTYREVGQTAGVLPPGYRHLRSSAVLGAGADAFTAAVAALLGWQAHLGAGLRVSASAVTAGPGTVVVLSAGAGPARISAPCRVVYVVAGPGRAGFAYGTLPGHPECGEQAFLIEQQRDGPVIFTITAFSRAATLAARTAGPLGRAIQRHITGRYLRALAT
ncbi:MAG TPA: DUF1990 domain-containing protein [Streptosporangiaceae bacterium]|nr:DUF1990 domain-containing protein [Streptosporangiaceae bacterium]